MKQGETVVVVGGAGYIGSVGVAALVERDLRVVVVDNFERGHRAAVHPAAIVEVCDLRDPDAIEAVFARHRARAVMHFGAYSLVAESVREPCRYFINNVVGGINLLEAMRLHGVEEIVFSSTAAVYGIPASVPIPTSAPTRPINAYGRSKLAFEQVLESYAEAYGLRYAILRYFNAAGATPTLGEDHKPETHLIPLVLQVASGQRDHVCIYGTDYDTPDGTCIRDYIHVSDLIDAHLLALDALAERSTTLNLGNGTGYSVRQVIETARKVTGHPIPVVESTRRTGDPPRLVACAEEARTILGWRPSRADLETILKSAWDWHRQHPHGYAS